MLFDLSVDEQEYIEDCEVCCNPVFLKVRAENGLLISLECEILGQ